MRFRRIRLAALYCLTISLSWRAVAQPANWSQLYASAKQLLEERKYAEALPIAQQALRAAASFGPESQQVSVSLFQLGNIYIAQGRFNDADPLLRRSLAIDEKIVGPQTAAVAADLSSLAYVLAKQGKRPEAEAAFRRALAIDEKNLGPDSPNTCQDAVNLAGVLQEEGRFADALALYRAALTNTVKKLGNQHPNVAAILHDLGGMSLRQHNYDDAANYYRAALAIREKALGAEDAKTGETVSGLAETLENEGRSAEAIPLYSRAMSIFGKALGPENLRTAREAEKLGRLLTESANLRDGCPLLAHAEETLERTLGPDDEEVARALTPVGECLHYARKNDEAELAYRRALAIDEKIYGPSHQNLAAPLNFLASLYHDQGKYADADPLYRRALAIEEKTLGPDHPATSEAALGLAINYYGWGKPELAEPLYDRRMQVFTRQLGAGAGYMSERDRLAFLASSQGAYPIYFSFVYANRGRPGLAGKMYDLLINEKGVAAGNSAALRARILASGDRAALGLLDQLRAKKTQVSTIVTSIHGDPTEKRKNVAQLSQEINDIEENLARRAAALPQGTSAAAANWRDVQKALQPGEAAVEYVRFQFHDGRTFTNVNNYAALVVTWDSEPKLIPLGEAVADEKTVIDLFAAQSGSTRGVSKAQPTIAPTAAAGPDSYNVFWKPLEPALSGAKRVYVAADAILNQFPIGLFADGANRMLMEKYDLRQLNSTKDLLRPRVQASSKSALLLGNPTFDLTDVQQRAALTRLAAGGAGGAASASAGEASKGSLAALPATQDEVDLIAKTFQSAGWQVQTLTGDLALKEAILRQRGPRVLHLATHGFFVSTTELRRANQGWQSALDPMLQSGLFFAGANRTLAGAVPVAGLENGILTSYEVAQLNLEGSELVVLSACETGRGEQQANGEGVFGLRRALQEAGAQAVLMSMWSVPDRETQELMALFYKKWLAGADKHDALRQAQLEERETVRQRYGKDLPFYWGAFVLVGR